MYYHALLLGAYMENATASLSRLTIKTNANRKHETLFTPPASAWRHGPYSCILRKRAEFTSVAGAEASVAERYSFIFRVVFSEGEKDLVVVLRDEQSTSPKHHPQQLHLGTVTIEGGGASLLQMPVLLSGPDKEVLRPFSNPGGHLGALLHLDLRLVCDSAVTLHFVDGPHFVGTPRLQIPVGASLEVGSHLES